MISSRNAALLLAIVAACSATTPERAEEPLVIEEGCQLLLARTTADEASRGTCILPYPSDFYRTPSGIKLTGKAKVQPGVREPTDLHDVVPMDGFSLVPTIVATLPSEIVRDGLPNILDDPKGSAEATSSTVIVDAESGAFVPHYADKPDGGGDRKHDPIVLHPLAALLPKHRYVVALQGVRSARGGLAPAPVGFRRLRDRVIDPDLTGLEERFEREVFPVLANAGIMREGLQLAWDFTTGSAEEPRRDLLRVRDLTRNWLSKNTPAITVTEVKPAGDRLERTVIGTITAPLFLDQPGPGARLFRDPDGSVVANGTTTFPFTATIPTSLTRRTEPGRAVLIAHGFFGGRDEVEGNPSRTIGSELAAVAFAIDWWGMASEDLGSVVSALDTDPAHGSDFVERLHQAMANWIVLVAAIKGPMLKVEALQREGGSPYFDPSFIGFFGASLGHILGATFVSLEPSITRVVLNVGGGGFTHIMPRSANFQPFSAVLGLRFGDPLVEQAYLAAFQRAMDRIDPYTYAPLVVTSKRKVLMQTGIGDCSIPNAASFLHAKILGLKQTLPAPKPIFGLEPMTNSSDSALTLFDYHVDIGRWALPQPLATNPVHDTLRINPRAVKQIDAFLRPSGVVIHPCEGPCDPE